MTSQADAEFAIHKEAMAYIHIQRLDQHATELYKTFPGLYNWGQLWDMLQPDDARHGGVSPVHSQWPPEPVYEWLLQGWLWRHK